MQIFINSGNLVVDAVANDSSDNNNIMILIENGIISVENYAIDVKVEFSGNQPLSIACDPSTANGIENTLTLLRLDTVVPNFTGNNRYILHMSKTAEESILHVAFASQYLELHTEIHHVWRIEDNGEPFVLTPYLGGWLLQTGSGTGITTESVLYYVSEAMFETMGATKVNTPVPSKYVNANWLCNNNSGGGDEPSGDVYEYVDLGLSVLWATKNIGANAPSDSGGFFAWGDTEPRTSSFNWTGYKFIKEGTTGSNNINKYQWADKKYQAIWYNSKQEFVGDGKRTLDATDDAAQVLWGGTWRMPSKAEVQELINNCTWEWQQDYQGSGISGWLITSNVEGYTSNSIFLPAAGHYASNTISSDGEGAFIWTAELYVSSLNSETTSAYSLCAEWWDVDDFEIGMSNSIRSLGFNIRPVCKK